MLSVIFTAASAIVTALIAVSIVVLNMASTVVTLVYTSVSSGLSPCWKLLPTVRAFSLRWSFKEHRVIASTAEADKLLTDMECPKRLSGLTLLTALLPFILIVAVIALIFCQIRSANNAEPDVSSDSQTVSRRRNRRRKDQADTSNR